MLKPWMVLACALGLFACFGDDAAEPEGDAGAEAGDAGQRDAAPPSGPNCENCTLAAVMPTPGVDCGVQSAEGRDPAVVRCVEENLASGTPFHAVAEQQGTDSEVALGWVLDEEGTLSRYLFDSSICGGSGCEVEGCGPRVSVVICVDPTFIPDEDAGAEQGTELITCGSVQDQPDACGP